MNTAQPTRCALSRCGATDGVRFFVVGLRCRSCTPSALAGQPEPDELLARHRAALATARPEGPRT